MAHDRASMSTGALSDVFEGLAKAVDEFVAPAEADRQVMDDDSQESWEDPSSPTWPYPQRALRRARSQLRRCRAEVAREFAAWWADLASVALADTAEGVPVWVVRAAVGDPSAEMSDDDLQYLPGRTFRGEAPVFVDQQAADYRRDQLWGADWTDYRVPPLPELGQLSDFLAACRVPADGATEVCEARQAIAAAVVASRPLRTESDDEAAMDSYEGLTGLLVDYARLLTAALQKVWSAAR